MKRATKTVAPKTDPKPTMMPFRKDSPIIRHGCFRIFTNSRSFRLLISFVSSLTSLLSSSSSFVTVILLGMGGFGYGAGRYAREERVSLGGGGYGFYASACVGRCLADAGTGECTSWRPLFSII